MKQKDKFVHYSIDDLRSAVGNAICWSDVCRSLDVTICTYNNRRMQRLCEEYDISYSHFDVKKAFMRGKREPWSDETLFVENCSVPRSNLRKILIRLGHYSGKCEECGIPDEWNGKPLTIEIDHVNGVSTDNRKENLRWLCPNCHSQTHTYRRRNCSTE